MADTSLFPATKAINPAVIKLRKSGLINATGNLQVLKREQDLSSLNYGTRNSKTTINSLNYFQASNSKFELTLRFDSGKKTTVTKNNSGESTSNDKGSGFTGYLFWSGSTFGHGIGVVSGNYDEKSEFSYPKNGGGTSSFQNTNSIKSLAFLYRFGMQGKLLGLSQGLYITAVKISNTNSTKSYVDGVEQSSTATSGAAGPGVGAFGGYGIGVASNNFHFETSVEAFPASGGSTADGKVGPPVKASVVLETKIWALTLGAKANYYINGFMDLDQIIVTNMVYGINALNPRLETIFDFALGADKGHSLSGSIGLSTTTGNEKDIQISSTEKFPTTTKSTSLTVKYGYVF